MLQSELGEDPFHRTVHTRIASEAALVTRFSRPGGRGDYKPSLHAFQALFIARQVGEGADRFRENDKPVGMAIWARRKLAQQEGPQDDPREIALGRRRVAAIRGNQVVGSGTPGDERLA